MTDKEARELAEAHWEWLESLLHKVYVDAMIHGIKHGKEGMGEGYHEHRSFKGSWHAPVWVQKWVSGDTDNEQAPEGTPISCAICGRLEEMTIN